MPSPEYGDDGCHDSQQQLNEHRQVLHQPMQSRIHRGASTTTSSWRVTYLLQSAKRGWQRHKSQHVVSVHAADNCLDVTDTATFRIQERVDLTRSTTNGEDGVAFVAASDGQNIIRFTLAGQPVRKFALIADSGRDAVELCRALCRQGVSVIGIEDLPDTVFLQGGDQRTALALEAEIPNLSRPEVQAYIVRLLFQDSFHQFVADLGEVFSHVQAHLPVPASAPTSAPTTTVETPTNTCSNANNASNSPVCTGDGNGSADTDDGENRRGAEQANGLAIHVGEGGECGDSVSIDGAGDSICIDDVGGNGSMSGQEKEGVAQGDRRGVAKVAARNGGRACNAAGRRGEGGRGKAKVQVNKGGGRSGLEGGAGTQTGRKNQGGVRSDRIAGSGNSLPCLQRIGDGSSCTAVPRRGSSKGSPGGITKQPSFPIPATRGTIYHNKQLPVAAAVAPPVGGHVDVTTTGSPWQEEAPSAKRPRTHGQQPSAQSYGGSVTTGSKCRSASKDVGGPGSVDESCEGSRTLERRTEETGRVGVGMGNMGAVNTAAPPPSSSRRITRVSDGGIMTSDTSDNDNPKTWKSIGGGSCEGVMSKKAIPTKSRKGKGNCEGNTRKAANAVDFTAASTAAATSFPGATTKGEVKEVAPEANSQQCRKKSDVAISCRPVTSSGRAPGLCKTLKNLWSEVNKHPSSWAFAKKVNVAEAPDYLDVVKHPIDLETIRKRLDGPTVHYNGEDMLHDDLVLMCQNAMVYNCKGTDYYRAAEDVLQFIEAVFER